MKFNPRSLIPPFVLILTFCLALLSITVNTNYAHQITHQSTKSESDLGSSSRQFNSEFPESIQRWEELIETSAKENDLDPNLIGAVILQESGGNPRAYSSSGAVGLMQIMPKDGIASGFICGNQPCFINRPTINELFDPRFNIQFGSNYLSGLVKSKGSEREALRAYGPMDMGYHYADIVLEIYDNYR